MWELILVGIVVVVAAWLMLREDAGPTLYQRLGGVYNIAAVVNYFSDELLKNPILIQNPQLAAWDAEKRLPGLKFMRTLWFCQATGGPYEFVSSVGGEGLNLTNAHCPFKISPSEFAEVTRVLQKSLQHYNVPAKEQQEVIAAFKAHQAEVTFCH
jgi:hemoglobin